MNAVPDAQAVIITNEGDESAAVLHELADAATGYIETGTGDARLGMFSWSVPRGANPTDLKALAYANPDLGNRLQADALLGQAMQAVAAGGETLARFRIEMMCQRITSLNPAVDPDAWATCGTSQPVDLAEHRQHVALCHVVALDASHASLVAAAAIDGTVHVEVVQTWIGHGCTQALRRKLPDLVARIRPRRVGWFPAGPAAAVAANVAARKAAPDRGHHDAPMSPNSPRKPPRSAWAWPTSSPPANYATPTTPPSTHTSPPQNGYPAGTHGHSAARRRCDRPRLRHRRRSTPGPGHCHPPHHHSPSPNTRGGPHKKTGQRVSAGHRLPNFWAVVVVSPARDAFRRRLVRQGVWSRRLRARLQGWHAGRQLAWSYFAPPMCSGMMWSTQVASSVHTSV
nr:hypothetical protein [Salinispora arenicola]